MTFRDARINMIARRVANQTINRNMETKQANQTSVDGSEIFHNNFVTLNSAVLSTTQGVADPSTTATSCRIGDEIMLRGVSIKFMVELNERYSDVTFRFLLVKCAKGDTPTRVTLWNSLSDNKMIDTFNTERYTIIKSKTFKMTAPNPGTVGVAEGGPLAPSGWNAANDSNLKLSRATKIMKFWIPGSKFRKGGKIQYENASSQPKFFDYHALIYAYSNYTTFQDIYFVGRVNDYVQQLYYKDA